AVAQSQKLAWQLPWRFTNKMVAIDHAIIEFCRRIYTQFLRDWFAKPARRFLDIALQTPKIKHAAQPPCMGFGLDQGELQCLNVSFTSSESKINQHPG